MLSLVNRAVDLPMRYIPLVYFKIGVLLVPLPLMKSRVELVFNANELVFVLFKNTIFYITFCLN